MKTTTWIDIIFGVIVMPGMMFLFPIGDWVQWHSSYVLMYIGWLYLVFILSRKALGPVLLDGKKGTWTVIVFIRKGGDTLCLVLNLVLNGFVINS